ncbi:sentrin-specific protease 1-like isoform X2 [Culex pipiens pallens]|uniref:sentrin-specific protease 1-like isoform X2 n=2 Tax=Culex pipiens pallens TaxID=42434 RepID=UPI0019545CE9|nr:sentrin-specific protease 1-like isoform X2 [Culex pipiens pallens]
MHQRDGSGMSVSSMLTRIKHYLEGRKRKSSDDPSDAPLTTFPKYRRVAEEQQQQVPRFISTPLSNDLHSKPGAGDDRLKYSHSYIRKPMAAESSSSSGGAGQQQQRQSAYFGGVTAGKTRLEFADIEFSDDDDDLDWINHQIGSRTSSAKGQGQKSNVQPLRCPPPLAKLKTFSTPVPSLFPIRSQLVVNGNAGHSDRSSQDTFKKPFIFKSKQQQQPQSTKRNSIIVQNYNQDEVNKYRALLKRLLPNLYSPDEPTAAGAASRKDSLLSAHHDEFNLSSSTALNASHHQQQSSSRAGSLIRRSIPVIDLSLEESDAEGRKKRTSLFTTVDLSQYDVAAGQQDETVLATPPIDPVNTLREKLETNSKFSEDVVENVQRKYSKTSDHRKSLIEQERENLKELQRNTQQYEGSFERKLGDFMLKFDTIVLDEEESEEEEEAYPELTEEHQGVIKRALYGGPRTDVVMSKFNISITRNDLATLIGDNWLNDEVINFYMNLLMERSEQRADDGVPRVYAMNTFFIPKLLSAGHSGLKRWTRKVDIFTYDIIPVPVHVGRVHWCMAIIDLKNKAIRYYDSMGTPNNPVLNALEQYLRDESLDKRKKPFDTSDFQKQNMHECPRQMNGSDCGVFSCMFAEHEARGREIGFCQQHMPYFRQKMIYEISQGRLLT